MLKKIIKKGENMMTKKTLTALGFILGSAFLTQANADEDESKCLSKCVTDSTINECFNGCNMPDNDACSLKCLAKLEKCFSDCGRSPWPSPSGPLSTQSAVPTVPAAAK